MRANTLKLPTACAADSTVKIAAKKTGKCFAHLPVFFAASAAHHARISDKIINAQ
jgi:hypothetical protein